jgi:DNA invertase Pin-like site-specific DNA recombinase
MVGTNGSAALRVVLYARVSTRSQQERGLSLPAQLRELREWAGREGFSVLEEVADEGGSDSKRGVLERPGINRVLDICEREGADLVVAQDRDRFGEHPVPDMLALLLARHGARLATPEDWNGGVEDEGAELLHMVSDWNAKRERKKTAARSRARKLEQARQGYVVPSHVPAYGFAFAGDRASRTYAVDEEAMQTVRWIYRESALGRSIRSTREVLNAQGVPAPQARHWNTQTIRDKLASDLYRPHHGADLDRLVAEGFMLPHVAQRAPVPCGIFWYSGRDYVGEPHRVAVPIPDAGIPAEHVERARQNLARNRLRRPSGNGGRTWVLDRGILRCAECGRAMQTRSVKRDRGAGHYFYYRCQGTLNGRADRCGMQKHVPAEWAERTVLEAMLEAVKDKDALVAKANEEYDRERRRLERVGGADVETWRRRLLDLDGRVARAQRAYLEGVMGLDDLKARTAEIEAEKEPVARLLREHEGRAGELDRLREKRDRAVALIRHGEWHKLGITKPEARRERYRELDLTVYADADLTLRLVWNGGETLVENAGSYSSSFTRNAT